MNTWVDLLPESQEDAAICLHSKALTVYELCKKKEKRCYQNVECASQNMLKSYYSYAEALNYHLTLDQPSLKLLQAPRSVLQPMSAPLHYWWCVNNCVIPFPDEVQLRLTGFFLIGSPQFHLWKLGFTCTLENKLCCEHFPSCFPDM